MKSAKIRGMQNQLITETASRQFQSAIVNNHAEHPDQVQSSPILLKFFENIVAPFITFLLTPEAGRLLTPRSVLKASAEIELLAFSFKTH